MPEPLTRSFAQVDVFGSHACGGNPVAVVLDADGLDEHQMLAFARWTNLSETTFVLPPTTPAADYRARIFTPAGELPFAGHPTLGTCHAWTAAHGRELGDGDEVVQECGAGLVRVRSAGGRLAFAAPPLRRSGEVSADDLAAVTAALRIAPHDVVAARWVDNGPGWVAVLLRDDAAVLAVAPGDIGQWMIGVVGPRGAGDEAVEVRAFFGVDGRTVEDPVTGSLNASLAGWLVERGVVALPYVARQGTALGRSGLVHLSEHDGALWVAGSTETLVTGDVLL